MYLSFVVSTAAKPKKQPYVVKRVFLFLANVKRLGKVVTATIILLWSVVSKLGDLNDEALV